MIRLLTIFATLTGFAVPATAAPALWQVEDEDSVIWLFGSFHVLPEEAEWRTEWFDHVLAAAQKVVFEADIRPAAQAELGAKAFARGIYVDGSLLTDRLNTAQEEQLRSIAQTYAVPVGTILAMQPWLAANTLSIAAIMDAGYSTDGVEAQLQPQIDDERLDFLETGDEQLDFIAGATEDEQLAMLEATLAEMPKLPKVMDKMMNAWLAGTTDRIGDLFLEETGGFAEAFLQRLIYDRNQNWIPALQSMLEENEETLVIVGAAHLIGEGSVLDLMEKAGYRVTRLE